MSILVKPYEISIWQDIWQGNKFCEQRLGIIGTNEMLYQGRAIEPNLVRNVNGTKKFSFKMYKHFIDTTTGEKVDNPFIEWLISERKVKLKYEKDEDGNDIWYDFIIKDVVENSSNYLYTYQLEDALVQELSKNGFGVTLDEQLRNNMGNVEYLATETLKETDWFVDSEVFVERVDEALVYVQLPESLSNGSKVYKLLDDGDDFLEVGLNTEEDGSVLGKTVLAFYSSCRNKPHRFQFIYLPKYDKADVSIDKNRQILNKNCQYYIEFEPNEYKVINADYGFILPEGFGIVNKTYADGSDIIKASDSTISTWYRGGRYGFAQKAEYIPVLDRYCQKYSTENDDKGNPIVTHYGYVDNKYEDLIFSTNLVENTEFSNTSGWTSTYNSKDASADKAVIENVYGKFVKDKDNNDNVIFISTTDVLAGTAITGQTFEEFLNDSANKCAPYLKVELKSGNSLVINSGPYHNRTIIKNMPVGSKWALRAEYLTDSKAPLEFDIDEYIYDTTNGHYSAPDNKKIDFEVTNQDGYTIYTVKTNTFTDEKDFTKNCKLKIAISGNEGTYYIKNLEFFRVRFDKDNKVIPLEKQGTNIENLITTQYRYFKPSELDTATDAKDIHYDYETDTLSYKTYKPVYNTNGEKIRAVSAKESNYFNILQSIAETFECWLDLQIIRNDPTQPGAITQKIAKFKNYAGGDNYARFRYGVNLKDIQRTYSSKNIVTKLMVKQNSNEHGENGICTIARAGANPTGDTSIYNFSYFQNKGLMSAHDYIDTMYKIDGAEGPDIYACLYSSSETKPGLPSSYVEDDVWHIKKKATDKYVCFWRIVTNNPITYECVSTEACDIKKEYNIQGYFPRIRAINDQLLDKIDEEVILKQRLLKLNSDLEVQKAKQSAATSGMEEASESYFQMTGVLPTELVNGKVTVANITLDAENKYNASNEEKKGHLSYYESDSNPDYTLSISTTDNKITIAASPSNGTKFQKSKTLLITAHPILTTQNNSEFVQTLYFTLKIEEGRTNATSQEQTPTISTEASQVKKYFNEYAEYAAQKHEADIKVPELESSIAALQDTYNILIETIQELKNHKIALNNLFFTRYSRFIQEGSWIDEKYYDDEKYYNDALSVMYNSCYPQVAYTINTFEVSQLPGYEMFNFNVGEKTSVEDDEFFGFNEDGSPKKEEVVITEKSENLDDPSKNTNKVQNFKNQFQDLFQRITATVQQAQYSTGAYEKGVAEANAIAEDSVGFLREAMSAMIVNLDNPKVMSESTDKSSQLRIVDGKVLIGKRNQNTEEISWTTGLSSDGIAADLINTGRLNTNEIQIYGGDNPTFRWDAKGISAYDYTNFNNVISGVNTNKFVRFDKHGIYGINGGIDGSSWYPTGLDYDGDAFKEIDSKATFALTWKGLKVTNENKYSLRIGDGAKMGDGDTDLLKITDAAGTTTFAIKEDGTVLWGAGSTATKAQYSVGGKEGWHDTKTPEDYFVRYSYDGGNTWGDAIQIQGRDGVGTQGASLEVQYQYADSFEEVASDRWDDTYPETELESILWMRQRLSDDDVWSGPIQISARDGSDIEYIYYRSSELIVDWNGKGPNKDGSFKHTTDLKNNWTPSPQGVSETYLYEYMTHAKKQVGATDFDNFNDEPVIWSKWSKDGESAYYIYHDKHGGEGMPGLPTETDYTKIGTPESAGDNGWYTIQTSDSVYQTWKICKPSEQPTTSWGPVKRIDGTLTNYNDLWNALDEKSSEDNSYGGIYTIKDGEDKYIGIKANFIKTGALCVGDNPYYLEGENKGQLNPEANNKFYADLSEDGAVRIAGWEVTGAGLEKNVENDEGEEDNTYVGMYSGSDEKMAWPSLVASGGTSYVRFYAGLKKNDDGSISECNFAVLEDGSVYLQKAQVGGNSSLQLEEDKEPVEIASIFTTMSETQSLVEEFNEELSQNTVSELQSSVKGLTNNYTSIQETLLINLKPKSVETQSVGDNIYAGELQFKENV